MLDYRVLHCPVYVESKDYPLDLLKRYLDNQSYLLVEISWVNKLGLRLDYIYQEEADRGALIQYSGDPNYYLSVNYLIDKWDVLTDHNSFSESLKKQLTPYYLFTPNQKEVLFT